MYTLRENEEWDEYVNALVRTNFATVLGFVAWLWRTQCWIVFTGKANSSIVFRNRKWRRNSSARFRFRRTENVKIVKPADIFKVSAPIIHQIAISGAAVIKDRTFWSKTGRCFSINIFKYASPRRNAHGSRILYRVMESRLMNFCPWGINCFSSLRISKRFFATKINLYNRDSVSIFQARCDIKVLNAMKHVTTVLHLWIRYIIIIITVEPNNMRSTMYAC